MSILSREEKDILFAALRREEKFCKENGYPALAGTAQGLIHLFSYDRLEEKIVEQTMAAFEKALLKVAQGSAVTVSKSGLQEGQFKHDINTWREILSDAKNIAMKELRNQTVEKTLETYVPEVEEREEK